MQIKEESLPQAWGRLLKLLNALPDHPLKKPEILDIFYNGLTDASRDYLDSCAGSLFSKFLTSSALIPFSFIDFFASCISSGLRNRTPLFFGVGLGIGSVKIWFNSLDPGCVRSPQDMIYYFSAKYFPAHKKQAALRDIYNFVQIEEESLPQAWGRLLQLLNALPDHPLKKNEILDIFYNGLTDASRDYLDSCAGSVFRERTPDEAEILLNNMLTNENNWTLPEPAPEPIPKPTLKTRGIHNSNNIIIILTIQFIEQIILSFKY